MKKVFSLLLLFMVSLTLFGISQDVSADAVDATIYLHVYQHDGVYANTGVGTWDGINAWNQDNTADTTDEFGGIIAIPYTSAVLATLNDSIEFKLTSDVTDGGNNLLAPGDGKVMLDITTLKVGSAAGTMTELHAYYVEGASEFYLKEIEANGLIMIVYVNPQIASDPGAYTDWGIHTWNTGDPSTGTGLNWDTPHPFSTDVVVDDGEHMVPMKLGVIEVASSAENTIGFIVHKGDSKACPDDLFLNSVSAKAGEAGVIYYEHGLCAPTADYATFTANVAISYQNSLKNKFMAGTIISDPMTIDVNFFGTKNPFEIIPSNFIVKDSEGIVIPVNSVSIAGDTNVSIYDSVVTPQSETVVVLYVDTALVHSTLGIAGSMQGWSPETAVVSTVDDTNGYAVFEFTSFDAEVEFVLLSEDGVDDVATADVDESTILGWNDTKISGDDNLIVDLSAGGVVRVYFNDTDNTYIVNPGTPLEAYEVDKSAYTYTSTTTCDVDESLFTLFIETDMDHTLLGIVGDFNGWDIANAVAPIGETSTGLVVFEVCAALRDATDNAPATHNGEFKVKYDTDNDGFGWDSGLDPELNSDNMSYDFGTETNVALRYDLQLRDDLALYTPTLTPVSIYRLMIYIVGGDSTLVGITGGITEPSWTPASAVAPAHIDEFGNAYYDIEITSKTGEFKVLYDMAGDEFVWDDSVTGDNFIFDLGAETQQTLVIDISDLDDISIDVIDVKAISTGVFELNIGGSLEFGEVYTVEYIEVPANGDTPAEIISWELGFDTTLRFVEANVVEETGTYALSPSTIQVVFDSPITLMTVNTGLGLFEGTSPVSLYEQHYTYTNKLGTYESDTTCETGNNLLYVYFKATTEIETLAQLGMVGSVQTGGGWDIDNLIAPVGIDTEGNYVFELCVEDTKLLLEFKILYDISADGFAWSNSDDVELVTGNIVITVANGPIFKVEEGEAVVGSRFHTLKVSSNFTLDPTSEYTITFVDGNGFNMYLGIDMDTEAPIVTATISGVAMEVNGNDTDFDLMNYFTVLSFIDNREGELDFEYVNQIDLTTAGEQTITIKAVDMWMNETTYDIIITVIDDTNPVLTLEAAKTFDVGTTTPTWASFATTNEGSITVDTSQVDMTSVGVFYVNYTAEDASGNQTLGSIEVTINSVDEKVADTGCFSSLNAGSSIIILVAALGGAAIFFTRKHQ